MEFQSRILDRVITGQNLRTETFADELKDGMQMVIFPRHLGCNLSVQMIAELRQIEQHVGYKLPLVFVSQGSVNYCNVFWKRQFPEARVIYDSHLTFARGFGLNEGTLGQVVNPASFYCTIKAIAKGYIPNGIRGNIYLLPGVFMFNRGQLFWSHVAKHATDTPDFENLVKEHLLQLHQRAV